MAQRRPADWMDETCRVALAACLHDLGKLTQRSGAHDGHPAWDAHVTLYCPFNAKGGFHTHQHAAATALAFDAIEPYLPPVLTGDVAPFNPRGSDGDVTDSFVNAAARHHVPATFLQWCVAAGDRIASGFERADFDDYNAQKDGHITARLLVAFEEYGRARAASANDLAWRYPLKPLSPSALFPEQSSPAPSNEASRAAYDGLWRHLREGLTRIPSGHRGSWPLWMDAFDALWLSATHAIPSAAAFGTRPDVSLYDHSRTTAAFAAAIWRHHAETGLDPAEVAARQASRADWGDDKLLLVQGDFAGIQRFIFDGPASTRKRAAKLLRGRSAFIALLCELAALKVLDALGLPPTSQVINAAGKFLIVAPNTPAVALALEEVRGELDVWFLKQTFGLSSVVIEAMPASPNDFVGGRFKALRDRLRRALEVAKTRRFGLAGPGAPDPVLETSYPDGVCPFDGRLPADACLDGEPCSHLSRAQIELGGWLARSERPVLIVERVDAAPGGLGRRLDLDLFGYSVRLAEDVGDRETPVRAFDLSLPGADPDAPVYAGLARRAINARVPVLRHPPDADARYKGIEDDGEVGDLKTFEHLAREAQRIDERGKPYGVAALGVLKGDVDDLGRLFAESLDDRATFAGWAALSRRMGAFFNVVVPHLCARDVRFSDIYTVFAGGDDFLFIGPWRAMKAFAVALRRSFSAYVAGNSRIHFSAAYVMAKPGHPIPTLVAAVEDGLERAKARPGKDAVHLAYRGEGDVVSWALFNDIVESSSSIETLVERYRLSTAFLYDVLTCADMAGNAAINVVDARWRAMLTYRTRRHVRERLRLRDTEAEEAQTEIMKALAVDGIDRFHGRWRHVLSDHIYGARD